ncbi:MAG: hypothetical protein ABI183_13180 [Polyangiaceae bacterium]
MRKIFLAFGLVGLGAMSVSFAACSSSSGDDSAVGTDSGSDTSVATDTGTGTDTGTKTEAGAACATCSQLLSQGLAAGSPCAASVPILSAALSCVCKTNPLTGASGEGVCDEAADAGDAGPDGGSSACSDLCANAASGAVPTGACTTCAADNCSTEVANCEADAPDGG